MDSKTSETSYLEGKRVVICEDEGVTILQLQRVLQIYGMNVAGCEQSGEAGVATVLREKPDLVLMDIGLHGLDGIEATNHIMAKWPTCILMLTGQSYGDRLQNVLNAGASGVIYKPVTSDLLIPNLINALHEFRVRAAKSLRFENKPCNPLKSNNCYP